MKLKYGTIVFFLVALFISGAFANAGQAKGSWKYFVERTTTDWDKLTNKKKIHIDRAFVYYGAGVKQAGGQVKEVPQVVYVDANRKVCARAAYFESPFVPRNSEKLTLSGKFPENQGFDRDSPLPVDGLPKAFEILPLKPKAELKKGLRWNSTWYLYIGMRPEVMFPATISHEVTGYKKKQGRKCAVIEYGITGEFKSVDHPEVLTERERLTLRGEFYLKGKGTTCFDTAEGIIVEKEQTISWTTLAERVGQDEEGKVRREPTADKERTVTISVSLIPEEGPKSRLLVYLLIGAGIVIAAVVLLRRTKRSTSIQ